MVDGLLIALITIRAYISYVVIAALGGYGLIRLLGPEQISRTVSFVLFYGMAIYVSVMLMVVVGFPVFAQGSAHAIKPHEHFTAGAVVGLKGVVGSDSVNTIRQLYAVKDQPTLFDLDSRGGDFTMAAYIIVAMTAMRDVAVVVRSGNVCASACTMIFLAAPRRYLEPGAVLAFHSGGCLDEARLCPQSVLRFPIRQMIRQSSAALMAALDAHHPPFDETGLTHLIAIDYQHALQLALAADAGGLTVKAGLVPPRQ